MFISRRRYEQELKEAYEKGRYEADERHYTDRAIERLGNRLDKLVEKVRKLCGEPDPAGNIPCVDPAWDI